jgi:hypothetical protein
MTNVHVKGDTMNTDQPTWKGGGGAQVGPYRKCCHVQTRAHGHVLLVALNVGIYHRRIYLMFTDQVHCMYRQFSAYTQLHCGLQFSIRNLS